MIKVFLDSSVVFKLIRAYFINSGLQKSSLLGKLGYQFFISDYVVVEVLRNLQKKYGLNVEDVIESFVLESGIILEVVDPNPGEFSDYVDDVNDKEIIAHTKLLGCVILLTNNIKHFDCDRIKQELGINVQSYLD